MPEETVAIVESSEVIVQSFESMLILLYNPPFKPTMVNDCVSFTFNVITAGVAAI